MRAFFRTLINLLLLAGVIWLIARYTTLDDKLIAWVRSLHNGTSQTTITSCDTPRGVKIPNGSSVFAYEDGMPDAAGKCHEERRTCAKGVLQGTFTYPQCTETNDGTGTNATGGIAPTGASCTTPWGQSVAHGNYMVAYESPSSCRFQRRMCVDGQLLGKFNYNYCMIGYAGGIGANGGQAQYDSIYATDNANLAGQGGNGGVNARDFSNSIYGDSPYANGNWNYSQVQYGGSVSNRQLPSDYWNQNSRGNIATVNSWNDEKLNPNTSKGIANSYQGAKDWKNNTTNYDLTMKGCQTPWGTHVDHGQFVIAYRASVATKGGSCEYERRTCMYGKLNGSFTSNSCGGKDSKAWQYGNEGLDNYYWTEQQHTTTQSHKSCRTPWGAYVKDGDYVRAYKYASSPWSDGCEGEVRYCRNGQLDGSYSNKSCALTTPTYPGCYGWNCGNNGYHDNDCYGNNCGNNNNGCHGDHCGGPTYNNACSLPWGGNISNGQYVTAWTLINGNCYSEQRQCSNGYLNGSYSMQSCTPTTNTYVDCRTPWGGTVKHGQSVEAFASPTAPCTKEIRRCYNGTLNGSYQYQFCNTGNPGNPGGNDSYGSRASLGWMNSVPHEMDTCQGDAIVTFVCTPQDRITCVDVRKVEDDCCIANRAKYEKRVVTCTN